MELLSKLIFVKPENIKSTICTRMVDKKTKLNDIDLKMQKKYFIRCAKQTPGIARIDMKQLKSLSVLIPPLADQMRFVFLFQAIDKSKLAIQKSIDELEILKEPFMQAYFG